MDPKIWPHRYTLDHDLNKIESILPKNASTQVTAFFLGPYGFWGEHFFKNTKKNSIILNYIPLKEDMALHLNKLEGPSL